MRTTMHTTLLATALAMAGAVPSAFAQGQAPAGEAMTEAQVTALLAGKGFRNVHDVKFEHGLWQADADSGDGKDVDLRIDPVSGRIYGDQKTSRLGEADIRAALAAGGYSKVHDLKFEDGLWQAEAERPGGQDAVVYVDPNDGRVIGSQND
ncbi:PepSY domain-containing protein [Pseudomonas sp. Hp2]|nr:PepSY domain-containing protein [Pseudomonas sp. Hp2]